MPRRAGLATVLATAAAFSWSDDWPQWRGPQGNGVSAEKGLPARWGARDVAWKARLGV